MRTYVDNIKRTRELTVTLKNLNKPYFLPNCLIDIIVSDVIYLEDVESMEEYIDLQEVQASNLSAQLEEQYNNQKDKYVKLVKKFNDTVPVRIQEKCCNVSQFNIHLLYNQWNTYVIIIRDGQRHLQEEVGSLRHWFKSVKSTLHISTRHRGNIKRKLKTKVNYFWRFNCIEGKAYIARKTIQNYMDDIAAGIIYYDLGIYDVYEGV